MLNATTVLRSLRELRELRTDLNLASAAKLLRGPVQGYQRGLWGCGWTERAADVPAQQASKKQLVEWSAVCGLRFAVCGLRFEMEEVALVDVVVVYAEERE